jgi:DNA-binding beta-propeller fold protein YncE
MARSPRHRFWRQKDKSEDQEMKRSLTMRANSAVRSLRVLVTSAMLVAVLTVTIVVISPSAVSATKSVRHGDAKSLFYTTSGAGTGLPNGAEIFAIAVRGAKVSTRDIGPTHGEDCASLALSPQGTLYSMCGPLFGVQQLATIDQKTGRADLFGVPVDGLAVMAMAFGPSGTLYAVGGCNPDPTTFECTPGSDPTYNSLYKVNERTGAFTRIGSTGAPELVMDLTVDRQGNMLAVTTTVNPSAVPAILYHIDLSTGKATKLVNLVGSNYVMGLALGRDGKLYATDNFPNSGLYLIDTKTGFETAIAALPFGFSSGLELMDSGGSAASRSEHEEDEEDDD